MKRSLLDQRMRRQLAAALILGVAGIGVSAYLAPERAWANAFLVGYFLITLGLGGALFIALTTVCGAGWSSAFRSVPAALAGTLPLTGVLLLAVLILRPPQLVAFASNADSNSTFWFKEWWLEPRFTLARAGVFVLLWGLLSRWLIATRRRTPAAVAFLFVFAITISLAGADWIMALEPLWFSTMWGVYQFSGLIMSALAAMIIACITLHRQGPLSGLFRTEHLHDLGKLLLGFSCFWMYIWFSQYMLIWYSNLPEETSYFLLRMRGSWGPVVVGSIVLNWVIPFFVLLPRASKRSEAVMLRIALIVLVGRWVDLYVMIFPPVNGPAPTFGLPETAALLILCSLAIWMFAGSFARGAAQPTDDSFLEESLTYHA